MANDKSTWRLTLTTPTGDPLFTLRVESAEAEGPKPSPTPPTPTGAQPKPAPQGDGEIRMTEPQKRYLFRLLGAQGVQGKDAEAQLKQYFRVANLRDITKAAASDYINQLAKDRKDTNGA
jgi:hypothetical protein